MDTLTHALSGALLARVVAPHLPQASAPSLRRALLVGGLTAAFPDGDVVIRLLGDQLTYLNLHRGVTHSLVLLPLWAMLLATLFIWLGRDRHHWRGYFLLSLAGITIHILGDVITSYGTQLFAPFSPWKASLPFTFIIDLWFSAIIIAGLLASWRWRHTTLPASLALTLLAGYVGLQALQHGRAVELGTRYAQQQGMGDAQVVALPQPLSPFNWKIIVSHGDHYAIAYVNLHRAAPLAPVAAAGFLGRIDAVYQPAAMLGWQQQQRYGDAQQEPAARELWNAPSMAEVRRFITYPALALVNHREPEGSCVWFDDLRFTLAELRAPFRFGGCRHSAAEPWRLYRLSDDQLLPL